MDTEDRPDNPVNELSLLAAEIDEAVGGSFAAPESKATVLNDDGAWEYHFKTGEWGFVAAGPDVPVETTYPGWGTVVVEPGHCAVFSGNDLAGVVSPYGGRIGGHAATGYENVGELETAMVDAFRTEYRMLTTASERSKSTESGLSGVVR